MTRAAEATLAHSVRSGAAGQFIGMGASLIAAPIVARLLGPDLYGLYLATSALVALTLLFSTLQLQAQVSRGDDEFFSRAWPWAWILGGVAGLTLLSVGGVLALRGSARGTLLIAFGVEAAVAPAVAMLTGRLAAQGDGMGAGVFPALVHVMRLVTVPLLLLVPTVWRPTAVAAFDAAAILVLFVLVLHRVRPGQPMRPDWVFFKRLLRVTIPLVFVSASWIVIQRSDVIILDALGSSSDVGRYGVALKLAQIPLQLQSAALVLAIPVLKRTRSAIDTAETFRAATRLLLPLTLPALVVIAVAGRDITAAMFGSQFDLGGAVYIWLAAGGLVSVATGPTGPYLVARSLDRALIIRSAVAILINIGTNIALIPRWGALGAAISTAVSLALLSLSGLYVVGRSAGAHPLGLRHLFRVVASVGTIAAAVVVARELTHGAWARTIVCSVVAVAASVASDWRSYRDLAMRRKPVPQ